MKGRRKIFSQAGRLLLAVICAYVASGAMARAEIPFFLSPTGNDFTGNGSITNPWQTVIKARNYIRTSGLNINQADEIVVYLRGGRYEQSQTLAFTPADSGTNGFYITYKSYSNELASISGGKAVTGWSQVPGKPYWVASVSTGSGFANYFRQLYVNGIRAERARSDWITGVGYCGDPATSQTVDGISFNPGSFTNYSNVTDLRLLHIGSFKVDEFPVTSIVTNITNGLIEVRLQQPYFQTRYDYSGGPPDNFLVATDQWMFVQAFEELDEPGEWCLNRTTQQVFYYPYSYENMSTAQVYAPVVQTLISFTGTSTISKVQNIRFQNLVLEHGNWFFPRDYFIGGTQIEILFLGVPPTTSSVSYGYEMPGQIMLNNTKSIQFIGNTIRHMGSCGIHPYNGALNTLVQGNSFYDLTGSAVMGGRWTYDAAISNEQTCTNTIVENNVIRKTGQDFMASALVDNLRHYGFQVLHNDMADSQNAGFHERFDITSGSNVGGTIVSYNRVSMATCGSRYGTRDSGFIYSFGVWPNSAIQANDINDVNFANGDSHGMYLDNNTGGFAVISNVMRNVKPGIWGYKLIRAYDTNSNIAIGNFGDATVNIFTAVASNLNFTTFSPGSIPAPAQAIINAAGLEPAYTNLLNQVHGGTNLARGKFAWASSQAGGSITASAAVDWNYSTLWQPTASGTNNCWWAVDLGGAYAIQRIEIAPQVDSDVPDARCNFQVQGANDSGFTNATVLSEQNAVPFAYYGGGYSSSWVKYVNQPQGFRYLRVLKTASGTLGISEFQVFGYPSGTNPATLLWDASAAGQKSDGSGGWNNPDQWWNGSANQVWLNGSDAIFGNTNGGAGTILIAGDSPQVNSLTFNSASSGSYQLTGSPIKLTGFGFTAINVNADAEVENLLTSSFDVQKYGGGTLTLGGSNSFAGAVNINSGVLKLAHPNAAGNASFIRPIGGNSGAALALSGGLVFESVPLQLQGKASSAVGPVLVNTDGTNIWSGSLSMNSGGGWYPFRSDGGRLTILSGLGPIASLTGTRTVILDGAADGEFSGPIPNGAASTIALQKTGSGTWTLSGNNTYTGATVISNGTLVVNGSIGGGSVTVAGGTLAGSGTNKTAVTIQSGGILAPGEGIGKLMVTGNLQLQGSTVMEIARNGSALTNDLVSGINTNTLGGTLMVVNAGSSAFQVGDTFKLFAATNYAGAFATITYPSGYTFTNRIAVNGNIQVLTVPTPIPTTPTNLVWNITGGTLTLSWPTNYLGWSLQVQTNSLDKGLSTNWVTIPGSETVTSTNLPIMVTNATVFYRLKYQP